MHGLSALLILALFVGVAIIFFVAIYFLWKDTAQNKVSKLKALGFSAFVALWFVLIARGYVERALFHHALHELKTSDVQSIRIGKHEFRERAPIEEIASTLRQSRWFEVNHGGWGDAIPLVMTSNSGKTTIVMVAKYFREQGAVVARSELQDELDLRTVEFSPELPKALEKYGVALPDCDTPHGRPCSQSQLNP